MSNRIKTVECRLYAPEATLQLLWELMAQKNTPLMNELLTQLQTHPDFEAWLEAGELPSGIVKQICNSLKKDPAFVQQPGRFYTSATTLIDDVFKSWLAIQKKTRYHIQRKEHWLSIFKSDLELEEISSASLEEIEAKAQDILNTIKNGDSKQNEKLFNQLFPAYDKAPDALTRCACAYLLKNQAEIREDEETLEEYAHRRKKKENAIQDLKDRLKAKVPQGRDLGDSWADFLDLIRDYVPPDDENVEVDHHKAKLMKREKEVPFPVVYESNTDLSWFINAEGKVCVKFNGIGKHPFEIRCGKRQLPYFRRFAEDYQIWKSDQDKYSTSLFTLRSGRLLWQEGEGKGKPWQVHALYLQCSIDTRYWTAEGSREVAKEKKAEALEKLERHKQKDISQQNPQYIKKQQSLLKKIDNPYPRPSRSIYHGNPGILVGVGIGLEKPATVAVVDATRDEGDQVIVYRSTKQLLGKKHYPLLDRRRKQQLNNSRKREKAQKRGKLIEFGSSELGEYIDRLLAKAIVAIAKEYQAGSIVLPELKYIRDLIKSEVQAKAEKKVPNYKEGQKKYGKKYRKSIHQWSYNRLTKYISEAASHANLTVEIAFQPRQGSFQEKAKNLALTAYRLRQEAVS